MIGLVLFVFAFGARAQAVSGDLTDEDISKAIEKIKDYLYGAQASSGAWFGNYHQDPSDVIESLRNDWGPSAIALQALIVSGDSPQSAPIKKGLDLIASKELAGIYPLAVRMHVWSYLPSRTYGKYLKRDADKMYRSSYAGGQFAYILAKPGESFNGKPYPNAGKQYHNSAAQYGILALWQASQRGINVPSSFWAEALTGFLSLQSKSDGGWGYSANDKAASFPSMTLAGLTALYVVQQELFRGESMPNPQVQNGIARGLAYIDKHFAVRSETYSGYSYLWYGYERVGLASGRKYFGGRDWFQDIAREIIAKDGNYRNEVHSAAFDLMFLSRGRVPVWINKLEIPGSAWNNRPNDIYFLNRFISEYREHEVNWQVVGIDTEPKQWIAAPLMWISSNAAIEWTDEYVAKLKTYLDLGGTIIANPEEKSSTFRASIVDLAKRLYPDLTFEDMPRDHPMANLLEGKPRGNKKPDAKILTNGARVLMIVPNTDWGMTFQKDKKPNPDKSKVWENIVNIYGVVTDRGQLTPRLSSSWVAKTSRQATGSIRVVIPQWSDPAGRVNEEDVYRVMKNVMHNATGKSLEVQKLPVAEIATTGPALVHMMGGSAISITDAERDALKAYIESGGTILIENLGGSGDFAASVRDQLHSVFPGTEDKVSTRRAIITGRRLPDGSVDCRRAIYRRMVIERSNPEGTLSLRGWEKEKRYPVLLSYEDISLGMLGVKQYGINGYSVDYARNLMVNILLEADRAKRGG